MSREESAQEKTSRWASLIAEGTRRTWRSALDDIKALQRWNWQVDDAVSLLKSAEIKLLKVASEIDVAAAKKAEEEALAAETHNAAVTSATVNHPQNIDYFRQKDTQGLLEFLRVASRETRVKAMTYLLPDELAELEEDLRQAQEKKEAADDD